MCTSERWFCSALCLLFYRSLLILFNLLVILHPAYCSSSTLSVGLKKKKKSLLLLSQHRVYPFFRFFFSIHSYAPAHIYTVRKRVLVVSAPTEKTEKLLFIKKENERCL
jgi:hypothetical protein